MLGTLTQAQYDANMRLLGELQFRAEERAQNAAAEAAHRAAIAKAKKGSV